MLNVDSTYKIELVTTKGCVACQIMAKNIRDAIRSTSKEIALSIRDCATYDKAFLKQEKISDFPAVLFIVGDIIKYKVFGTYPAAAIVRWTDLHFK